MTIKMKYKITRGGFEFDVDIKLPSRGVTAIFGPSGCGKTTLLRVMAGLEHYKTGYLKVDKDIWQDKEVFVQPHKRAVGYVFQEASLFPHLNVRENLEYGINRGLGVGDMDSLQGAIKLLGIEKLLDRNIGQLSGGETQRVAIARALAMKPKVLLMDEPLSALDNKRKKEIMPYLNKLHSELEIPLIYVSHSVEEVSQLSDHVVLMDEGKVVEQGDISDMLHALEGSNNNANDANTIMEGKISDHDDGLTGINFPIGKIYVVKNALGIGEFARLRIMAKDVSISLNHHEDTSIINITKVVIDDIKSISESCVLVKLLSGDGYLLALITNRSMKKLKLCNGMEVYAQIKGASLI